jgi:hypothetical protein
MDDGDARAAYAVHIQLQPTGCDWRVARSDGRLAHGHAPDAGSARLCCDFTIATLEALRR